MDKKYTCRLGVIRDNRKEREKNLSNLPDDIGVKVMIMYTLEEISDTLAIMLDEMQKNRR